MKNWRILEFRRKLSFGRQIEFKKYNLVYNNRFINYKK